MSIGLPEKLDCTRCNEFQDYDREQDTVVRCGECGKRHSNNNLHIIDPSKQYERDDDGNLQEVPP